CGAFAPGGAQPPHQRRAVRRARRVGRCRRGGRRRGRRRRGRRSRHPPPGLGADLRALPEGPPRSWPAGLGGRGPRHLPSARHADGRDARLPLRGVPRVPLPSASRVLRCGTGVGAVEGGTHTKSATPWRRHGTPRTPPGLQRLRRARPRSSAPVLRRHTGAAGFGAGWVARPAHRGRRRRPRLSQAGPRAGEIHDPELPRRRHRAGGRCPRLARCRVPPIRRVRPGRKRHRPQSPRPGHRLVRRPCRERPVGDRDPRLVGPHFLRRQLRDRPVEAEGLLVGAGVVHEGEELGSELGEDAPVGSCRGPQVELAGAPPSPHLIDVAALLRGPHREVGSEVLETLGSGLRQLTLVFQEPLAHFVERSRSDEESPLVDEGHVSPPPSSPRTVSARRRECERRSPNGWGPIGWEPGISPISPAPSWPYVGDVSRPTPPAGDTSPDRADEKRSRLVPLLAAGLVLVVAGLVTWWGWPYIGRFLDAEEARRLVQDAGPWGPLVLIGMQIVQIVIAPIPGQITGLIGGYLFGPVL